MICEDMNFNIARQGESSGTLSTTHPYHLQPWQIWRSNITNEGADWLCMLFCAAVFFCFQSTFPLSRECVHFREASRNKKWFLLLVTGAHQLNHTSNCFRFWFRFQFFFLFLHFFLTPVKVAFDGIDTLRNKNLGAPHNRTENFCCNRGQSRHIHQALYSGHKNETSQYSKKLVPNSALLLPSE